MREDGGREAPKRGSLVARRGEGRGWQGEAWWGEAWW